jgi:alkanesulfonate monooxygenase
LVAVRPGLIHPSVAARALATIDVMSGGRVMLNLVCGAGPHQLYGEVIERAARYQRAGEFIDLVCRLWQLDVVDYEGVFL